MQARDPQSPASAPGCKQDSGPCVHPPGAMRDGHAAPAPGGATLSARASSWPQWSRTPVQHPLHARSRATSNRPAGRSGEKVMLFYLAICSHHAHCAGDSARLSQTPVQAAQHISARAGKHYHSVSEPRLDRWKSSGVGMGAPGWYDRVISLCRSNPFPAARELLRAGSPLVPVCVVPHLCATAPGVRSLGCPG